MSRHSCTFTYFSGKKERQSDGCYCQPLDSEAYVSMIVSTFGEFCGQLSSLCLSSARVSMVCQAPSTLEAFYVNSHHSNQLLKMQPLTLMKNAHGAWLTDQTPVVGGKWSFGFALLVIMVALCNRADHYIFAL